MGWNVLDLNGHRPTGAGIKDGEGHGNLLFLIHASLGTVRSSVSHSTRASRQAGPWLACDVSGWFHWSPLVSEAS
jgi:hypothetical protein